MKREIKNKTKIVNQLNSLLSNYEMYYQNLRALHWNIKGNMFFMLHAKYEEMYNEASEVIDEIAERILTLGETPSHTFEDFIKNSSVKAVKNVTDTSESLRIVLANQELILEKTYEVNDIASDSGDEGTVAMLSEIISQLEKSIWMFKASKA